MHVDIDACGVDFEEQHVGRVAVVVQHVLVGLFQRMGEHLVAYETAIDENILGGTRTTCRCRQPRQAAQAQTGALRIDRDGRCGEIIAEHGADAVGAAMCF